MAWEGHDDARPHPPNPVQSTSIPFSADDSIQNVASLLMLRLAVRRSVHCALHTEYGVRSISNVEGLYEALLSPVLQPVADATGCAGGARQVAGSP